MATWTYDLSDLNITLAKYHTGLGDLFCCYGRVDDTWTDSDTVSIVGSDLVPYTKYNKLTAYIYAQYIKNTSDYQVDSILPTAYSDSHIEIVTDTSSSTRTQININIISDYTGVSKVFNYGLIYESHPVNYNYQNLSLCLCGFFLVRDAKGNVAVWNTNGYCTRTRFSDDQIFNLVDVAPSSGSFGIASEYARDIYVYGLSVQTATVNNDLAKSWATFFNVVSDVDIDDPDSGHPSGGSGGGGDGNVGGDTIEDDGLPPLSAIDTGLMTIYSPNVTELKALGNFLWSDSFDLNTFKKLFNDPFDAIFGLSIIPITVSTTTAVNVVVGNIDTGVAMPVVSSQWVSMDMGTVSLNEIYGSAMDYDPNTQVSIYLPFIGMRNLNTVDVMASTIHLIYKFDVLTGSCVAQLYVNHSARSNSAGDFSSWTKNQGFLYSFEGQCAVNIPLSGQDFTNTIRAAIGAVGMTATAAASMATGNAALGVAALAMGTANLGIQANTSIVERSGHLSGSQALLNQTTPALIVIRPHRAKPSKYYALRGLPSQTYAKLSDCSGYTMIAEGQDIKASGATDSELEEITRLLEGGVYL